MRIVGSSPTDIMLSGMETLRVPLNRPSRKVIEMPVSLSVMVQCIWSPGTKLNLLSIVSRLIELNTCVLVARAHEKYGLSFQGRVIGMDEEAMLSVRGDVLFPSLHQAGSLEALIVCLRSS